MTFAARPGGFRWAVQDPLPLNASISSSPSGGGDTTWTISFTSAGAITGQSDDDGGFNQFINNAYWYLPASTGVGSGHYVRLTVTAGTSPDAGDATSSWLHLNLSKGWVWTRTTSGTTNATVTFEVADDSGGSVILGTKSGISLAFTK